MEQVSKTRLICDEAIEYTICECYMWRHKYLRIVISEQILQH